MSASGWPCRSCHAACASKAAAKTASAGSGCSSAKAASAEYAGATANTQMIVFTVSGMTCGGCASKIESAVAALEMEGVEGCEIDVAGGKATIRTSGKVCTKTLESAITKAGFTAEIVDAGSESTEDAKS